MGRMDIKLSDNILINCPERGFTLRRAKACFFCQFYGGINRAESNGKPIESNQADAMQVICGRPITRKLIEIEAE